MVIFLSEITLQVLYDIFNLSCINENIKLDCRYRSLATSLVSKQTFTFLFIHDPMEAMLSSDATAAPTTVHNQEGLNLFGRRYHRKLTATENMACIYPQAYGLCPLEEQDVAVYYSATVAITKWHQLGDLNNRNPSCYCCGGQNFKHFWSYRRSFSLPFRWSSSHYVLKWLFF